MADFTNDTCTLPTESMRQAITMALLGDDIMDGDPTTLKLEEYAAELFGKEAAVFVHNYEFSNQLAIFTHCTKGNEIIITDTSRMYCQGGASAAIVSGVQFNLVNQDLATADVNSRIRPHSEYVESLHKPYTRLITYEISRQDGTILPLEKIAEVYEIGKSNGIPIHVDGHKLFNASASTGVPLSEYGKYFDTLTIDLTDCLRAPLGSLLLGTKEFALRAKRGRKMMGGALRQSGVYAAAGLVSLQQELPNINLYNEKANKLAIEFQSIHELTVDSTISKLNFIEFTVNANLHGYQAAVQELFSQNITIPQISQIGGKGKIYIHSEINEDSISILVSTLKKLMKSV